MSFFVYIATTRGPSGIRELLVEDEQEFSSQLALFGQDYAQLPISKDYAGFTVSARRILLRDFAIPFPPAAFITAVDRVIDGGDSWQLGIFTALALKAAGKLETDEAKARHILWVTGKVHTNTKQVEPVDGLTAKLESSAKLFAELRRTAKPCTILLPSALEPELRTSALPDGVRLGPVATLAELLTLIGVRAEPSALDTEKPAPIHPRPPPVRPRSAWLRHWPWLVPGGVVLASMGVAVLAWMPPTPKAPDEPVTAVDQPDPPPIDQPPDPPAPTEPPPPTVPPPAIVQPPIQPPQTQPAKPPVEPPRLTLLAERSALGLKCSTLDFARKSGNRVEVVQEEVPLVLEDGRATVRIAGACGLTLTITPAPGAPVYVRLALDGLPAQGLTGRTPLTTPSELQLDPTTRHILLLADHDPITDPPALSTLRQELSLGDGR